MPRFPPTPSKRRNLCGHKRPQPGTLFIVQGCKWRKLLTWAIEEQVTDWRCRFLWTRISQLSFKSVTESGSIKKSIAMIQVFLQIPNISKTSLQDSSRRFPFIFFNTHCLGKPCPQIFENKIKDNTVIYAERSWCFPWQERVCVTADGGRVWVVC